MWCRSDAPGPRGRRLSTLGASALVALVLTVLPVTNLPAEPESGGQPPTDQHTPAGSIAGKNIYLPYLGYLSLPEADFSRFPPGAIAVRTRHYYVNEFRPFLDTGSDILESGDPSAVNADYESYVAELGLSAALTNTIRTGIDVRLHAFYGGFLDAVIEGFHALFNLPNSYRHYFEQNAVRVDMTTADGVERLLTGPSVRLGDVDLWAQLTLAESRRYSVAAMTALKLPVPDPDRITSSGRPDLGASINAQLLVSPRLATHADVGVVVPLERRSTAGFPRTMLTSLIGMGWSVTDALELVVDLRVATPPYVLESRYGHPLFGAHRMYSLPQTNLIVGFRRRFEAGTFEFYVEEDFLTWEGADIVVAAAWRSRLR